jgi:hypothetical protein
MAGFALGTLARRPGHVNKFSATGEPTNASEV